jgi:uncharacterized protein (TIGR02453 family)
MATISKSTIKFLKNLTKNNHKAWFEENRSKYEAAYEEMWAFGTAVQSELSKYDELVPLSPKKIIKRINRDVRFSKDKTPYKGYIMGGLKRDTVWKRGGYSFRVMPGSSGIGCGFWAPEKEDLKLIRSQIAQDPAPLRKILKSKKFRDMFGQLEGEQLKRAPKDFDPEHEAIDLLRYKQFLVFRHFTDAEVTAPDFQKEVIKTFRAVRPFFDYMSEILTHDTNGVPLYK